MDATVDFVLGRPSMTAANAISRIKTPQPEDEVFLLPYRPTSTAG
jgi:hypothetical protein